MASIIQPFKIDLQQKPVTAKYGSIFNLRMLLAILDGSHYQNTMKIAAVAPPFEFWNC